jgi:hypothetical protein
MHVTAPEVTTQTPFPEVELLGVPRYASINVSVFPGVENYQECAGVPCPAGSVEGHIVVPCPKGGGPCTALRTTKNPRKRRARAWRKGQSPLGASRGNLGQIQSWTPSDTGRTRRATKGVTM